MGRAEPLPRVLCKGEGLPRERSSAGNGVAIIPRCVVSACHAGCQGKRPKLRRRATNDSELALLSMQEGYAFSATETAGTRMSRLDCFG